MIISNHLITGKTKFIAHIGFPTKSFTAPKILNPYFNLINKDLPNMSFLMVKGSNSTGLNKIIKNL